MLILQILFIFHNVKQQKCQKNLEGNFILNNIQEDNYFKITPGIVETKYLYKRETPFNFYISNEMNQPSDLIINFYSVNFNIKIKIYNKGNKNDNTEVLPNLIGHDKDTFSLSLDKNEINNTLISIEPLNNDYYYNYNRTFPLIINSIINKNEIIPSLNISEKEPIYLSFNGNFKKLYLIYELKNITNDSFIALLFSYHENANFKVTISDENGFELKKKVLNILDSDNIFLTNELKDIKYLSIKIKYNTDNLDDINTNKIQALLKLEIKTNKSPPTLLEKNYINKGLITSNLEYKYFYFEIFKGEGGEIILHDKRQSGILIGSIIPKSSINDKIINPNIYPKINSPKQKNSLNYDKHLLKLYINFNDTEICDEGCYILISYYHEKFSTKNNLIIGFEFTLLLRAWDDKEFKSQIINIPLNEYVFGFFEKMSVKEHYYSFYISDEIDEIIIQIQGENFKGFYGNGKIKVNENLDWYNVKELNISSSKDIKLINTSEYKNNYISFLMKPKDEIFSFYYFRILLTMLKKENDIIIFPLDSNMGNNCIVKNNYCFFLLKNDYNIFSLNLTIFTSTQDKQSVIMSKNIDNINAFDFNLSSDIIYNLTEINQSEYHYVNFKIDNYTEYVIFPFAFEEGIVKNILSTFYDANKEIIPNIYSSNIYKLDNNNKQIHLSLKNNNFKINFGSFYGEGIVKWGDYFKNQFFGQNMQRQIYKIPIKDQNTDITFQDRGDFIIYIKLMNLNVNRIFIFESNVNDFVQNEKFPLYYILRLEEENNDSIDINLKIINLNDKINGNDTKFDIEGSLINIFEYEGITKYDRQLRNSIKGEYDVCTKIGYLNIPIKLNKFLFHLLII